MTQYTEFAPAERLPKEKILDEYNKLLKSEIFNKQIFDKIPIIILILNKFRQVVFANDYFKKIVNIKNLDKILGLRPGEIFNCIHSDILKGGCGTTKFCQYCGAVNAILASIKGVSDVRECTITQKDGNTIFLEVSASPVEFSNNFYSLFSIKDISDEKRKLFLEKQLLNKFYNELTEIKIGSHVLKDMEPDNEIIDALDDKIQKLIDEINFQKLILDAENYKLDINPIEINSGELLKEICETFNYSKIKLKIEPDTSSVEFISDYNLLFLILKLTIEYGLKDAQPEVISISAKPDKNNIIISIKTPKIIPPKIQYKLFQKDFLNIKESRIGIYLMHLIAHRYLKGDVLVTYSQNEGTTFSIRLPLNLEECLNLDKGGESES